MARKSGVDVARGLTDGSLVVTRGLDRPQVAGASARSFGQAKQRAFLDALAATCNVKLAAGQAGVSNFTVYKWRRCDPAFAASWREALEIGCERLEALVLEHGGAALPDPDAATGVPEGFDLDRALKVLHYRLKARQQAGDEPVEQGATVQETNDALLKALAAAQRRLRKAGDAR